MNLDHCEERPHVLVSRLDSMGDVLLAGPAVRAAARGARRVTFLAGPGGAEAAAMLPGVDEVVVWDAPWAGFRPPEVSPAAVAGLVEAIGAREVDTALILTSFHQSPLPAALLLRLAGVRRIAAASMDYPGSLVDVRLCPDETRDVPEAERALALARAAGFTPAPGDRGRLAVRRPLPDHRPLVGPDPYVVVHPGASVPARAWDADRCALAAVELADRGRRVVVTGSPADLELTAHVSGRSGALDLGGGTDLPGLASVLAHAEVVVAVNTGPAHLAAAVRTPVVSVFAPVVPAARWAPYGVPTVVLGDPSAACAGTRARECPVPGHPCLGSVSAAEVADAVDRLAAIRGRTS